MRSASLLLVLAAALAAGMMALSHLMSPNNPTPEKVINETLNYAKRQMTWFKRDKEIIWIRPDIKKVDVEVKRFLKN